MQMVGAVGRVSNRVQLEDGYGLALAEQTHRVAYGELIHVCACGKPGTAHRPVPARRVTTRTQVGVHRSRDLVAIRIVDRQPDTRRAFEDECDGRKIRAGVWFVLPQPELATSFRVDNSDTRGRSIDTDHKGAIIATRGRVWNDVEELVLEVRGRSPEDAVGGIVRNRCVLPFGGIHRRTVDCDVHFVREGTLRRCTQHRADEDLEVYVRDPTWIPTGVDGVKTHLAVDVCHLYSTHEGLADRVRPWLRKPRVNTFLVGVPDVNTRVRDRIAVVVDVDDGEHYVEWRARTPFGHILPELRGIATKIEWIWSLGLLWDQDAVDAVRNAAPPLRIGRSICPATM